MAISHERGRAAEDQASLFLSEQGLKVIERNCRKKVGELDIICRDEALWICVEVKYRQQSQHGHPLETVTPTKLKRMIAAFSLYLLDNGINPAHAAIRFDIIAIENNELIWLKNVTL